MSKPADDDTCAQSGGKEGVVNIVTLFVGGTEVELLEQVAQSFGRNHVATGLGAPSEQRLSGIENSVLKLRIL